ncbi:MAG: bestrophin family protein [Hyphomicrobium sp.]|uniref:bestrophin family protein n=1 Tax=Hyphomicrobium sp. TaxID=82 RepID=UPI0039E61447
MIVRPKATLFDILFAVRGSIAGRVAWRCLFITVLACIIVLTGDFHLDSLSHFGTAPFGLIGLAISIFMSFRNSAAYDRWWEGRKQWGELVVQVRSLCRELSDLDAEAKKRIFMPLIAYANALSARLRGEDEVSAARQWDADVPPDPNVPDSILRRIGAELISLNKTGSLSDWRYSSAAIRMNAITSVQAACERIKTTPLPFAYTLLIHRTVYLFCLLLPFALAPQLGWGTPIIVAFISYTFFGLDAIGDDLAEPFSPADNSLPVKSLVRTIERETLSYLGVTPLPDELQPVGFVLS